MAEVDRDELDEDAPNSEPESEPEAPEPESEPEAEASDSEPESGPDAKRVSRPDAKGARDTTVTLKVRRQDALEKRDTRRWERFEVPVTEGMTVLGALRAVQRDPRTDAGERVAPVAFDDGCAEEVCGACTMLVNGRVMLACSARISDVAPKGKVITLEPLAKFPLLRDLVVDRSRMAEDAARLGAWVTTEGSHELPRARPQSRTARQAALAQSACIDCGACLEACPQYGEHSEYVGAAAINHVQRLNGSIGGGAERSERLERLMAPGGIAECGKASNCVEVCPARVPLVDSLQRAARGTTKHLIFDWLLG